MTTLRKLVSVLITIILAFPAAGATQGRGFPGSGSVAALLVNKSVHRELKVTDDQVSKLEAFAKKLVAKQREELEKLGDASPDERKEMMPEINRTLNEFLRKGLEEILSPSQVKRFNQIRLQQLGAAALLDKKVQTRLELSDGQKTRIDEIVEKLARMRDQSQDTSPNPNAKVQTYAEMYKSAASKAESVLNDEQKKMFRELLGDPFEIKYQRRGQEP